MHDRAAALKWSDLTCSCRKRSLFRVMMIAAPTRRCGVNLPRKGDKSEPPWPHARLQDRTR